MGVGVGVRVRVGVGVRVRMRVAACPCSWEMMPMWTQMCLSILQERNPIACRLNARHGKRLVVAVTTIDGLDM